MVELQTAARVLLRRTTLTACVFLALGFAAEPALAKHRHHSHRGRVKMARAFGRSHVRHVRPGSYGPPFSVYAVDGNSGRALYGQDENALRHPASITKVMTLYLLFERLEKGQLSLEDRIPISEHAASMPPTKLGLRPGSTIRIEDAIKAIVTKSSNDMAVAIAERLGGDERSFAQMMTRKAHSLGMSRSNFVNASGLPDDMQLTTAHDLVILGRAIHDRYPHYFRFFSTPSFRYAGQYMQNHNHLMEQIEGMDGIKTGYTRSSGFNLLSSVNRNGHWLVSVVLGGKTRLGRDRIMADLIASQIDKCATTRTAPVIAENPALEHVAEAIPVIQHEGDSAPQVEGVDDEEAEGGAPSKVSPSRSAAMSSDADDEGGPAMTEAKSDEAKSGETKSGEMTDRNDESEPEPAPKAHSAPSKPAKSGTPKAVAPKVAVASAETVLPRPRPAFVPGLPRSGDHDMTATGSIHRGNRGDGATAHYTGAATATPSTLKHGSARHEHAAQAAPVKVASLDPDAGAANAHVSHGGWAVQVGATPTVAQANELMARAKGQSRGALNAAHPLTEKVQKGRETLYRARFAGLDAGAAENACRNLKRAGISCFATKD